jgi:hypothetical protein
MTSSIFWEIRPCNALKMNWRFGGTCGWPSYSGQEYKTKQETSMDEYKALNFLYCLKHRIIVSWLCRDICNIRCCDWFCTCNKWSYWRKSCTELHLTRLEHTCKSTWVNIPSLLVSMRTAGVGKRTERQSLLADVRKIALRLQCARCCPLRWTQCLILWVLSAASSDNSVNWQHQRNCLQINVSVVLGS